MNDTITRASHEWRTRPTDQRYTSLIELDAAVASMHDRSASKVLSSRSLEAIPVSSDADALMIAGPNGHAVNITHWSFGQLASRIGAPGGYLRNLPAPLAADCINYGLHVQRGAEDIGVLLMRSADGMAPAEMRAATGPNYGRIWNRTITHALVDRFGDGRTGDFRVPGEFGKDVEITKANTTLYASDQDMFVFLADERHRIEIPNRRNGAPGSLARGFFVWNSEVGAATLGVAMFLFDYVCANRIVWGAEGYKEIRIRHTSSAPDRWLEEVRPVIEAYAESAETNVTTVIANARKQVVADKLDEFLLNRKFTRSQVSAVKAAHLNDEQRPIETLWDVVTGVTAYARGVQYQDERVKLEREAGKILQLAA